MSTGVGASNLVDALRTIVGHDGVIDDADVLVAYQRDQAGFVSAGAPLAAVFPRSTTEVAAVVAPMSAAFRSCPVGLGRDWLEARTPSKAVSCSC